MIIDYSEIKDDQPGFAVDITLTSEGDEVADFSFEGKAAFVIERILEIEAFGLSWMAQHGQDLKAETKVVPLDDI